MGEGEGAKEKLWEIAKNCIGHNGDRKGGEKKRDKLHSPGSPGRIENEEGDKGPKVWTENVSSRGKERGGGQIDWWEGKGGKRMSRRDDAKDLEFWGEAKVSRRRKIVE